MNIEFSREEYRLLLDVLYLGQWMIEAHQSQASPASKDHQQLIRKLYAHAEQMGCGELVEGSGDAASYRTSETFQDESRAIEIIDEYNDENFWEELVSRLAERDAHADAKADGREIESIDVFREYSVPHEKRYASEFLQNGVDRLKLGDA